MKVSVKVKKAINGVMVLTLALQLQACSSITKSMEKQKANTDVHLQLGIRYLNLNRLEAAKENLELVIAADPNNVQAHNALAFLFEKIEKIPEARKHYETALKLSPEDLSLQNNFGRFLCEHQEFDNGLALLDKAIANLLNDRPWMAITNAGICQLGLGQQQKAKTFFKQALQANSNYAPALQQLQKISYQNREYWAAKGYLQRYLQVAQQNEGTLWVSYQTERALGNQNLAEAYRSELLEKFPFSKEAKQVESQQ